EAAGGRGVSRVREDAGVMIAHASPLLMYPHVFAAFDDVRERGQYASAVCPVRPHKTARLSFWIGHTGRLMIGCYRGCDKNLIIRAVGLTCQHFRPGGRHMEPRIKPKVTATYPYRDEHYRELYKALRWEPGHNDKRKSLTYHRRARRGDDPEKVKRGY